jgi:hypothetical protein
LASLDRDWTSERMSRIRLQVLLALRDGIDPANLPKAWFSISDWWQSLGYLVREGHVDRRLVHENYGASVQLWWVWLSPALRAEYGKRGQDTSVTLGPFEWLAGQMAEMDLRAGDAPAYDEASRTPYLNSLIDGNRENIRIAEELRAVIVRPMSTADIAPEPSAKSADDRPPVAEH